MNESVAVIAAHPDDEVLGCGGTIARLASEGSAVHVLLLADGETSRAGNSGDASVGSKAADRKAACLGACEVLGCASVEMLDFPDNRLDGVELLDIVKIIEKFLQRHKPSVLFTHHSGDVNIDHRVVHDAVISACRPLPGSHVKQLFFFEVPSSTEWRPPGSWAQFSPNWFVDISATLTTKLNALSVYGDELRDFPHPRSLRGVEALARWRGATVGVAAAEAFILGRGLV